VSDVRYMRVVGQCDNTTFTKRLLTCGTDEQTLNLLNDSYPGVHFFQVLECAELGDHIIKFVD